MSHAPDPARTRHRRLRAAGLAGLLLAVPCLGNVGAREADAAAPALPPPDLATDYLDAIDRVEGEFGPYATELSDLYLGLGQAMLDRQEYELALDAFNRGLMVVRVNSGPKSTQQTDHLYLIANVETLLGNTATADNILGNIYLVAAEQYGEDSLDMVPVIERMHEWYFATRPPGSDLAEYEDYVRDVNLMERLSSINELHHGAANPDTTDAYRRLGEAQFSTVRYLLAQGIEFTLDTRMDLLTRTMDTQGGVKVSIGDHYYAGRSAFKKYLESLQADSAKTPLDFARAYADLGDWYLGIGKYRNARQLYEQAYQVLAQDDGYADQADGYMAQPRPVHFFRPPPDFLGDLETPLPELHLNISMTVTRTGNVVSPEVLNAPEDVPKEILGDILDLLRETPFRPAMKSGDLITTKGFIWQFALLPRENAS